MLKIINNERQNRNNDLKRESHPIIWKKVESKLLRNSVSDKSFN